MDELLKTQRITISVLIVIGLLLIAVMVKKAPDMPYSLSAPEILASMQTAEQVTPFDARQLSNDTTKTIFVDVRSPYDFEVNHIPNAKNIPTAFLLDQENRDLFSRYSADGITIVLYGQNEREAVSPWILLQELGYANTKFLMGGLDHFNDKGSRFKAGRADYDYAKISTSGALKSTGTAEVESAPTPKKVIPIKKKVKREAEGGC